MSSEAQGADARAAIGEQFDQPFGGQHLQGFAEESAKC